MSEDDDGKSHKICTQQGKPLTAIVLLDKVPLTFEMDSGSGLTIISEYTYNKYFNKIPLTKGKTLYSYDGSNMKCIGVAHMSVTYRQQTHMLSVHVVCGGEAPQLGKDFMALFKLKITSCHFVSSQNFIKHLPLQYPALLSSKLGTFNKYKLVKLRVKEDSIQIFFKARPLAFALKDKVNNEINRLLDLGIIKPVEYLEYASPVVPVLKRDGSVRLCADYSVTINKQLLIEHYPLPTVHELFFRLQWKLFFKIRPLYGI